MAKLLIVGCGSIGLQLAEELSAKGHRVTGLKRTPPTSALTSINFMAADISSLEQLKALPTDFDAVYFIVSPDGRNPDSYQAVYEQGLNNLLSIFKQADANPQWILVSSTSVYGQTQGEWVDEASTAEPQNVPSRYIRQAELQLTALNPKNIVVRFSGIYGPGREYLIRMAQQGGAVQKEPVYYTNRIHQADCVGVLVYLLEQSLAGVALEQYYVASDNDPAPQWEVISWLAERLGAEQPTVKAPDNTAQSNKRCNNQRLKALGYQFKYPSYQTGYSELIKGVKGVN